MFRQGIPKPPQFVVNVYVVDEKKMATYFQGYLKVFCEQAM